MDLIIDSASRLDIDAITQIFNAGYEDYLVPVNLNVDQMKAHIERFDIDLNLSRIAYQDGDLAGICFLGKRETSGWIGGVGVAKAFRRQGIGEKLMLEIADLARDAGMTEIYLEYIVGNDPAGTLYQKLGYETLRRLLIVESKTLPTLISESDIAIKEGTIEDALMYFDKFHKSPLPWQRQSESLRRYAPNAKGWLAQCNGETVAYIIGIPTETTFHMLDIACKAGEAESLIALLSHLHKPNTTIRLVNLGEDDPIWEILSQLGYQETMSQYEMKLTL